MRDRLEARQLLKWSGLLHATTGAPFRERIPRDAVGSEPDLCLHPDRLRPVLALPLGPSWQVSRGLGREALGAGTAADRQPALPLVSRGERGRSPAAPPAHPGDV